MTQRALIGDAPRWITWHVVVVWAGIPAAVVAYVALAVAAARIDVGPALGSPRPVVTLVVVVTLLNLFRLQRSHRPLDTTVRRHRRRLAEILRRRGREYCRHRQRQPCHPR